MSHYVILACLQGAICSVNSMVSNNKMQPIASRETGTVAHKPFVQGHLLYSSSWKLKRQAK